MISDVKVQGIQQTTAAIQEGLGLVSNIYEGYKSKKEMATAAESLGAVEQEQGFMDWFMGGEKEYELGGDIFTGTQVPTVAEFENAVATIVAKLNDILGVLRDHKLIEKFDKL